MDGILDNHARGAAANFIRQRVVSGSNLSFVSAYFTIYAYEALSTVLDDVGSLRFLFGEPSFVATVDPAARPSQAFTLTDDAIVLPKQLHQQRIARQCASWIEQKVEIRSIREANLLHGKLYHVDDGRREHALLGSSNFTLKGLGLHQRPNLELNLVVDSDRDRADLKAWFDEIWTNDELVMDVKQDVLNSLRGLFANQTPEAVYLKTLHHLFAEELSRQESQPFDQVGSRERRVSASAASLRRKRSSESAPRNSSYRSHTR